MKISIDTVSNSSIKFHAGAKPRIDVNKTLRNHGFENRCIGLKNNRIPYLNRLLLFNDFLKIINDIKHDDTVVIQYPLFFYNHLLEYISLRILCSKCDDVSYLIHDIDYIRSGNNKKNDTRLLNLPKRLIVHNDKMKDEVKSKLLKHEIIIDKIDLFDYYASTGMISKEKLIDNRSTVAFAGNLNKSTFLQMLGRLPGSISWNLYGVIDNNTLPKLDNVNYKGKFLPDNPSILEAGWGLVWDGDSIERCQGIRGEYLKYNSPHKASLYLSRGMPLIVWKDSALAGLVENEKIGITVNSLSELKTKFENISNEDYDAIINNARRIGARITSGGFLSEIILQFDL